MDQIETLEKEIADLRSLLQQKENELHQIKNEWILGSQTNVQTNIFVEQQNHCDDNKPRALIGEKLPKWAIERYSRQILLQEIGVSGQEKLCSARVLIVGAGGLGCPAVVYLAAAGVGEIGIVDYDTVDLTNIHRQFLHGEMDEHMSKAESAATKLRSINSRIKVTPHNVQLDSQNALQLVTKYDLVLDCTDNVPTRYLLNDTCVLAKLPLISGSALKMEGQLTVYGYRSNNSTLEKDSTYVGPCYRCVFPSPPPAETVGSCSANGVAGPIPGVIGALQALEAIKYIVGQSRAQLLVERMLLFDGDDITFRTVKLRSRNNACAACSDSPAITQLLDYEAFCHSQAKEKKKQEARLKSELRKHEKQKRMSGQSYYGFRTVNGPNKKWKKQEARLKSELRKHEKQKRMSGQSYYGFRTVNGPNKKWVQDVPKSERKMGPPCVSEICSKNTSKKCPVFEQKMREDIFSYFWNELDWRGKKNYVKSLIDSVPVKRRRLKHKGEVSRKGDSKLYHLMYGEERTPVCRVMFLNTLGIKEAMVRCWLLNTEKPKVPKKPIKSLNVDSYIDNLPKSQTKCQYCMNSTMKYQYVTIDKVKNLFQLYNMYVRDMRARSIEPASRKTFSKDLDLQILPREHRISPEKLANYLQTQNGEHRHLLVDVRSESEFQMCNIDGSINFPIEKLCGNILEELVGRVKNENQVTFVCRRGNDSQVAASRVLAILPTGHHAKVTDLSGGLHAWAKRVDQHFPVY